MAFNANDNITRDLFSRLNFCRHRLFGVEIMHLLTLAA